VNIILCWLLTRFIPPWNETRNFFDSYRKFPTAQWAWKNVLQTVSFAAALRTLPYQVHRCQWDFTLCIMPLLRLAQVQQQIWDIAVISTESLITAHSLVSTCHYCQCFHSKYTPAFTWQNYPGKGWILWRQPNYQAMT